MSPSPLHLLHVFPTFAVGGAQTRFARLAAAHGARYRHTVIALDGVTDMASHISSDVPIEYRAVHIDKHRLWHNLLLFRRTLDGIDPDVLVTYNWGAIEWAMANRANSTRKHIHIEDGFGPEETQRQLPRRVWARRLALSGRFTTIIVPSKGLENIALREWRLPAARVLYIPNGIDCKRFAVDVASRKDKEPSLTVGTVATLRKEKNIERLIDAFCAIARDWQQSHLRLLIVGDGPERAALQRLASKTSCASQIHFTGAASAPEQWLRQMDVFALSSDTEQMPFSLLEAMASGLPIVSTSVGDVPHLVASDNAAQIVPVGDDAAYREALRGLLCSGELRMRLGQANQYKAYEAFDEKIMIARYAGIFG